MCGIAAFAGSDRGKIERMTAALVHRGPDGNAVAVVENASLGHARLAILDPRPEGDQPMWNHDRTVVIVFNGEIFNYRRIREKENLECRTNTDTEVLLLLYEKYGTSFVRLLQGMFAFALFDTRTRTWCIARDQSGIKPLYLTYVDGKPHVASEVRCLMQALPQKPAINHVALSQYVRLQYVPGPTTLCEGIESLPPGTVMTWQDGTEHRMQFEAEVEQCTWKSAADCAEHLSSLMDDVVKDHLISDKPVGIFLSGGMDSSILLHHAAHHMTDTIRTFTVRFDATKEEDEERFNRDAVLAQMSADHYGTEHTEVVLTAEDCRTMYKDTARAMDLPNADAVAPAQYLLSRIAKQSVDVVLAGAGGDELFGGYPRYRIAKILHALRFVPPSMRSLAARLAGYPSDVLHMQPGAALAERLLARPLKEINRVATQGWFDARAVHTLFQEHYSDLSDDEPVRSFMEFDRGLWLVDESLHLADAMTMASGLECRVPFLDARIIDASHAMDENWFVGWQKTKKLLKHMYLPQLPEHLSTLPKACFYPPLAKWFRRECKPLVEEMLESTYLSEYFDMNEVRTVLNEHLSFTRYGLHTLSTLTQLHCWFETVYEERA